MTKISGLTPLNIDAIKRTMPRVTTTKTTATFDQDAQHAAELVETVILGLPGRGHPKASLYAVVRKLRRAEGN